MTEKFGGYIESFRHIVTDIWARLERTFMLAGIANGLGSIMGSGEELASQEPQQPLQ